MGGRFKARAKTATGPATVPGAAPEKRRARTAGQPAVRIAPSILAADFTCLGAAVATAAAAGADRLHVDVMDGRFVPNISIGVPVVASLRGVTKLPIEAHLMIVEPERYVEPFALAGADTISVHQEASPHLHRTIQQIRSLGKRAGVVINPSTSAGTLEEILPEVDLVLIMTVNPGFGGQAFIKTMLPKITAVRRMIDARNPTCELEVDGGIDAGTAPMVVAAGARVLVAGSAIFRATDGITAATRRIADAGARAA